MEDRVIDILQHEVEFWLKDEKGNLINEMLHEIDTDYIEAMIKDGYNQGELCCLVFLNNKKEPLKCRGWWKIRK